MMETEADDRIRVEIHAFVDFLWSGFLSVTLLSSTPYSSGFSVARTGTISSAVCRRLPVGTAHAERRDCKPERSQRDEQGHDGCRKTRDRKAQR